VSTGRVEEEIADFGILKERERKISQNNNFRH
jgi:hypothetical protein